MFLFKKYFLKRFIYLFIERGERKEKERERNIDVQEIHGSDAFRTPTAGVLVTTQARALTGNRTNDLLVCR